MNPFNRALLTTFALWSLAACSRDDAVAADAGRPASASTTASTTGPTEDPCALTTDSDVRRSFAGAKAGKRDHSLDKYDIATCTWDTPTNMVVVQIFTAKGTVEDELRSRASGAIDPVKPGAGKNIRYEKLAGVGEDTMVAAEQGDAAQGLFNDIAVLVTRRDDRMAVLFARSLIDGDRPATLKALQELGGKAAGRL
jgi:hypothetical protein